MLCICDACGWTWRDWRAPDIRAAKGCAHCGAAWGAAYHAWDGRSSRTGQRARPVSEVWQGMPPAETVAEWLRAVARRSGEEQLASQPSQPAKSPARTAARTVAKSPARTAARPGRQPAKRTAAQPAARGAARATARAVPRQTAKPLARRARQSA